MRTRIVAVTTALLMALTATAVPASGAGASTPTDSSHIGLARSPDLIHTQQHPIGAVLTEGFEVRSRQCVFPPTKFEMDAPLEPTWEVYAVTDECRLVLAG